MCKLNDYQIDKNSSKLASKRANHSSKNKTTAALLAIFLGSFGIHKFYLSKVSGLWYLLFFWTWIPMLIGFIEGVFLLLMDEVEFDQKYNKENSLRRNSKYVESQIDQIERLADLKEKGLISEEEFHKTKNKILDS
ncbi:MAG: NINE protein [Candidatus Caenarcaniphilales bacterium]|nr:NINE protein [Candidatus Caenarcaniphilales bacterium]